MTSEAEAANIRSKEGIDLKPPSDTTREIFVYDCAIIHKNGVIAREPAGGTNVVEIFVYDCVHAASSFAHSSAEDLPIKVACYTYHHPLHRHPERLPRL